MSAICFSVPGEPKGKGRPRFVRKTGRTYTDARTLSYETLIGWTASQAMGALDPLEGPLCLTVTARFTPAASTSRKACALMLSGEIPPAKRPDPDNIAKAVMDGLNGVVWVDDAQVVSLFIAKRYAEKPGLDIVIRPYVATEVDSARERAVA